MTKTVLMAVLRILAGAAALLAGAAQAGEPASSMGLHGMVMFGGKEGLYASHMPMYHRPHDVQAVFRLRMADAPLDAELRRELARRPVLWTIVPERFELDRLAPEAADPVARLRADLVRGHFERGGATVHSGVEIVVERVLMYRRLDPAPRREAGMVYEVIDAGPKAREHYLVKRIRGGGPISTTSCRSR
ncbi:MAG TPA: hypothetical protein VEC06_14070 [Paucimonas sp.]|nr:hypothetical protein [Paucimonas sp.]